MGEARPHPNNRSAARRIVSTLREAGHVAYFAGGCVRDELLGLHPQDYDVATDATPERVGALFEHTRAVGRAFGVMLVRMRGTTVEVATFREEQGYSDHRRPDAVRFSDAEADARRRDFTINALFMDPLSRSRERTVSGGRSEVSGAVIDFVGGVNDLRAGVVRAVGDADARLGEDHLRALRGVRFAARLGFRLDAETEAAIVRHAVELKGVSRERVGEELRRVFGHGSRGRAAGLLHRMGLDGPVLGEAPAGEISLARTRGLEEAMGWVGRSAVGDGLGWAVGGVVSGAMAGLSAWALDRLEGVGEREGEDGLEVLVRRWREALCLTNEERDGMRGVLETVRVLRGAWGGLGVAGRKRVAGRGWFGVALGIRWVEDAGAAEEVLAEVEALARTASGIAPDPLISGYDLIDAGYEPGPGFARCLEGVYDAQLEDRVRDRGAAMAMARGMMGGGGTGR
ncbi:MAG: CCA tRNA nucleotidyltransferase [Phycisphaerales bacterium]